MSEKKEIVFEDGLYSSIKFLEHCTNEELAPLVKILTDSSTSKLDSKDEYKEHYPNHQKYVHEIIDDYEKFGGNTFANMWRGYGVGYSEILEDVCKQMKVNMPDGASLNTMELSLVTKMTEEAIEKMTPEELEEFAKGINPKATDFSKQAVLIIARVAIKQAGFTAYKLLTKLIYIIGTKILGKTVPFVVYQTSTKWLGAFAGPVGLALTTAWTLFDIAGPAFRVTIPSTIYIASLRQAKLYEASHNKCPKCETSNETNAKFCAECGTTLV
ncbi:zinc-ribbon domain-containing protein [Sulfurimonas crateris]|uniref:Zinc-ribbon domain-containing protein n=1 Tax=Sulfurimonas crateris TaxID=2574727 RepID=A0A4U2Z8P9_9BACT|nr:zinc-ribbon domain-containing protein [Sulfurimonas crateris]TKI70464.1 zinc-ribbon domain-containing protein [Sulfurimonas crateris]